MSEENEKVGAGQHMLNAAGNVMNQTTPGAVSMALGAVRDYFTDERRQKYYRENQESLFRYGQLAQQNAALNTVEGLKKAGLSPSLATGANGMSTASASMPSGSSGSAPVTPDSALINADKAMAFSSMLTQQKQRELLDSEIDLNDSRTEAQEIQNRRAEGEDYVALRMFDDLITTLANDATANGDKVSAAIYESMRNIEGPIVNKGFYDALEKFGVTSMSYSDSSMKRVADFLANKINAAKAHNSDYIKSLVIAPFLENKKIVAQISELGAMYTKLMSDVDVNKEMIPEIKERVKQIINEMEHTDIDDRIAKHNDLAGMLKDGDIAGSAVYVTEGVGHLVGNALGLYFGGKALAARKAVELAPKSSARNLDDSMDVNYKYTPEKTGETKKAEAEAKRKAEAKRVRLQNLDKANAARTWNKFYKEYKQKRR